MKNVTTICCLLLFFPLLLSAQKKFSWSLADAEKLYAKGQIKEAKNVYLKVYRDDSSFHQNNYTLAQTYSLLRMQDSAFYFLYRSVDTNFSLTALSDPQLYSLRADKRWENFENELLSRFQKKYEDSNPIPNIEYAKKLFRLTAADQAYFLEDAIIKTQIGEESFLRNLVWDLKSALNEKNLVELERLIAEEGWPKYSEVGAAASGAFLVIQHAGSEQQRKYLPMLRKACEEKEGSWQEYALMFDRLQIADNKPQRYGSQVHYNADSKKWELYPLENKAEVDRYRKEVEMGPLKDYVKQWDIEW